jgi:hypothetical protein
MKGDILSLSGIVWFSSVFFCKANGYDIYLSRIVSKMGGCLGKREHETLKVNDFRTPAYADEALRNRFMNSFLNRLILHVLCNNLEKFNP